MKKIEVLFANNRKWALSMKKKEPHFFEKLSRLQKPQFLWIGCSDSRVPANEIIGLLPGELFVHRNVGNIVYSSDLNCLSVLQYAIQVLKIKNIIVCGHYNCGGIRAVVESRRLGEIDVWLESIRDCMVKHASELRVIRNRGHKIDRLCELNVLQQAYNVSRTKFVQRAWKKGQALSIHAWIYSLNDGIIKELRRYSGKAALRLSKTC
jgi:carbonic anhydrase